MSTKNMKLPLRLAGSLPFDVIGGSAGGFNERADTLYQAADGTDLNDFWAEVNQTVQARNAQRNRLIDQFTFRVTELATQVSVPDTADFEVASEYGLPKSIRQGVTRFWRGYDFNFYDLALRYTWMFIAEADVRQMRQLANMALEADNRLLFAKVMKTMFNPINGSGLTDQQLPVTVYKFYNGDGEVPPTYGTNTFAGTHSHYVTTTGLAASATLTPASVEGMSTHMDHHGYTFQRGFKKVLWVNQQEFDIIKTWRVASGAPWDFIPDASNYGGGVVVVNNTQILSQPQGKVPGELGTYGPWHVVVEPYIPAGYLLGLVSGGPDNIGNPVGIREHQNPSFRGLKLIPGNQNAYPLVESFYQRGFGTGIRQRGAGVVCQVTASATYTVPAIYA